MIRHRVAAILLAAAAAFTIFDFLLSVRLLNFPDIAAYDKHVDEITSTLPRSGMVGYWNDNEGSQESQQEYYLLQYALAPRVVVKSLGQQVVISHVHRPESRMPGGNLELVRDFETGFKVFRKKKAE